MRGSPFFIGAIVGIVTIVVIVTIVFFFFGEQCGEGGCCMGVISKKKKDMNVIKSLCGVVVMAVLLPVQWICGELEKWCMVGIICAGRWGRDREVDGADGFNGLNR